MRACTACDDDPDARERLSDFRMNQVVELYPSRTMVPIVQSRCMEKNTMRFGPRMIDGEYTYGLFLDDIDKHLSMLPVNPWGNSQYAMSDQDHMENSFLCADDWRDDIESRSLFWDLFPISSLCVQGTVQMCAGVIATNRHLWLKVTNVACGSLVGDCDDEITVI
jgi:hypothetical protein